MKELRFLEVQRFRQPWLLALLAVSTVVTVLPFLYGLVQQLVFGQPWGDHPLSDGALIATAIGTTLVVLAVDWLLLAARLHVEVSDRGLFLRFYPFHWKPKKIELADLLGVEAITYRPIREYGGWGLRRGRTGWAYNVSGDRGVLLRYASGKTLLIGSQRASQLCEAIRAEWRG